MNPRKNVFIRVAKTLVPRERLQLAVLIVGNLLSAVLDLASVSLLVPLVAVLIGDATDFGSLWPQYLFDLAQDASSIGVALGAIFLLKNGLLIVIVFIQMKITNAINVRIVQRYFTSLLFKPYWFHTAKSTSELLRDVQDRAYSIVNGAINPLVSIVGDVLVGVTLVTFLVTQYPLTTLVVTLFLGTIGLLLGSFTRSKLRLLGKERDSLRGEQLHVLAESFSGIKDILVRGNQQWFAKLHGSIMSELARVNMRYQVFQALPRSVFECGIALALVGLLFVTASASQSTSTTLGMIASFAFVAFRILPSIQRVSTASQAISFNFPMISLALDEIETPMHLPPKLTLASDAKVTDSFSSLDFRVDEFRYPESPIPVLCNAEFGLRRGEMISIVGESGSGKSTIISLLVGLFEPTKGEILINGRNMLGGLSNWRERIGFVPQDSFLLDGTILENVVFDENPNVYDEGSVWRALDRAAIGDFVRSLPGGLQARIGEDGVRISGGQRQRLGFARALYRDPEVLILDEATSALDVSTEKEILELLASLRREVAIIMVTHRTNSFHLCDRVYHLRDGKLSCNGVSGSA